MKEKIDKKDFFKILNDICKIIEEKKDYLSELDRAIGDGDHGVTMSIGWTAIKNQLTTITLEENFNIICNKIAASFLTAVGASAGPLYATALMRGGAVLKDIQYIDAEHMSQFIEAAAKGIQDRGKAEIGDKTMLDVWLPAAEAMRKQVTNGADLLSSLANMSKEAEISMKKTKELKSRKGRSSKLGDRSIGHIDPGAASSFLILNSIYNSVLSMG